MDPDVSIELSKLGKRGTLLASGGEALVFTVPKVSLPDAPGALVYKHYRDGHSPPAGLPRIVRVRSQLDLGDRTKLDQRAAWPLRVVLDHGRVTGVLMKLIPDPYFQKRMLPSGKKVRDPREIQNLFVDAKLARFVGMPFPTHDQRMLLCRDLAAAMHLVHRNELVFGDFNARNAVFRLPERPSIMLVDCDAIRIRGTIGTQLNAPDWDPPEGRQAASQYTDRYKLGLFVLRCLTPGAGSSVARDPARADGVLDVEGRKMLRTALTGRRDQRPTAQAWGYYWEWRINGRPIPDQSSTAALMATQGPVARPAPGLRRDANGRWVEITAANATNAPGTAPSAPKSAPPRLRRGPDGKWHPVP